eukprot:tig00020554_g10930.t1
MNTAYDQAHLDELFQSVGREIIGQGPPWKVSLEAAGNAIAVEARAWPSADQYTAYRASLHLPDVSVSFATRELCSRSRATEFNAELVVVDEELAELEPADLDDPCSLGAVRVHRHVLSYFGWRIESRFIHASRRLPDGSALAILVYVVREGDCWTTRHMMQHARPVAAWHVARGDGGAGCRCTTLSVIHRSPSFLGFLSPRSELL